jgi:hypothetical protein
MRGRACLLFMLLALARLVFLGSESFRTRDHILLSQIRDFSFRRLLQLAGSRWKVFDPASTRVSKSKLCYDRRSDGQSVLVLSIHVGLTTTFFLLSGSCGFSLWRDNGFVVYNYCWFSPVQSFLGPSPAGLRLIFYCLIFESPAWRTRSPYLYPPGTGWSSYNSSTPLRISMSVINLRHGSHRKPLIFLYRRVHSLATSLAACHL